jgi:hypothetical protein
MKHSAATAAGRILMAETRALDQINGAVIIWVARRRGLD